MAWPSPRATNFRDHGLAEMTAGPADADLHCDILPHRYEQFVRYNMIRIG